MHPVIHRATLPALALAASLLCGPAARAQVDLLPDIIIRESDLYDHDIVTNIQAGHRHLRLSNGTPNIGAGKLYLYGVLPAYPDGTQDIRQRIYRSDGSSYDRPAGRFVYHPAHSHIHVEAWCIYRLREVLAGDGVGPIVAEGSKTSFCILDLDVYNSSLPNFNPSGQFHSCTSTIQGLSVGWVDEYTKTLEGQNIDITGVPDGTYWLESEADPDNHMLESDESNNVTRILVTLGQPAPILPDAFEPNPSRAAVDGRPVGGPNSPNLGPCGPQRVITGLTIDQSGDDDYFRFYMNDTGVTGDFVRASFVHAMGDVDMRLYNAAGVELAASTSVTNQEQISLSGRAEGWYYVRLYGYNGNTNPAVTLTVDPPQNQAPSVAVTAPPAGDVAVEHGTETYTVTWNASDPELDLTWVSVYVNQTPTLDGNQLQIPTSVDTPGAQGFSTINTAYLEPDTYWVYCAVTDGGEISGSWSPGTLTVFEPSTDAPPGVASGLVTRLLAATPNPFNPSTTLRLELAQAGHVAWRIFDVRGALVRTLLDGDLPAGRTVVSWDGRNQTGNPVASGIYYVEVVAPGFTGRDKLALVK